MKLQVNVDWTIEGISNQGKTWCKMKCSFKKYSIYCLGMTWEALSNSVYSYSVTHLKDIYSLVLNQLPSQQVGEWSRRCPAVIRLLGKARAWAPVLDKFHTLPAWYKWSLFEPLHTWNWEVTVQCFDNLCDQVQKRIFKAQSEQSCHSNRFMVQEEPGSFMEVRRKTSTYPEKMFQSQNTFISPKKNFHQVSSLLKRTWVFCSIISGWRFLAGFHLFLPLCQVSVLSCGILPQLQQKVPSF